MKNSPKPQLSRYLGFARPKKRKAQSIEDLPFLSTSDLKSILEGTEVLDIVKKLKPMGNGCSKLSLIGYKPLEKRIVIAWLNERGRPITQEIRLTSKASNLPIKASYWNFICPVTFKSCRMLYYQNGSFVHREALRGAYYSQQTKSHPQRSMFSINRKIEKGIKAGEAISEQKLQSTYKGEKTHRLQHLEELARIGKEAKHAKNHVFIEKFNAFGSALEYDERSKIVRGGYKISKNGVATKKLKNGNIIIRTSRSADLPGKGQDPWDKRLELAPTPDLKWPPDWDLLPDWDTPQVED